MIQLDTPLSEVHGINIRFLAKLKHLRVTTVRDLLWYFPTRYEDYSTVYQIADLAPGQHATVQGTVSHIEVRRTWQKRMTVVEAVIEDRSGDIRAIWFNQPYVATSLKKGQLINLAGKIAEDDDNSLYFSHPSFEKINASKNQNVAHSPTHTARLVPIYPETKGITSKGIRFLLQSFLRYAEVDEWMPDAVRNEGNFPEVNKALRDIHFPSAIEDAEIARKRFSFEELFLLQLANLTQKQTLAKEKAPVIPTDIEWLKTILAGLPYELTETQKRSLWEIVKDIEKSSPMNRLLQGDVGSGKTIVATLAALIAAKNDYQSAFMAPTEILARQHYKTLTALFASIPQLNQPTICLLTGKDTKIFYETDVEAQPKKQEVFAAIANGKVGIVIGTHALIASRKKSKDSLLSNGQEERGKAVWNKTKKNESISFHKLALVIVDEQHRFGVAQRAMLSRSTSTTHLTPHFLSMSATPIPRTLMMTVFGDLDVSLITELPKGRQNIITKIVLPEERHKAYQFILEKVKEGRQVFVICPRIESTAEKEIVASTKKSGEIRATNWDDVRAVKEEYEKLSKKVFPELRVAMLHGKMPSKPTATSKGQSKTEIMEKFRSGEIDILVATSVVEVGVDIPNAAIMMIEGTDRFGLAQLYQFRGRVGRGAHQSYCFLFTDKNTKNAQARLRAIVEAKNGFELAERDLKLRGPGQFLGSAQTGLPDIAMQSLQDAELVKTSRDTAISILEKDPELKEYPGVAEKLKEFEKKIHLE